MYTIQNYYFSVFLSVKIWLFLLYDLPQQPPSKALSSILGKSNLQFSGMNITLNISTSSLNLMTPDTKQVGRINPDLYLQHNNII